MVQTVDAVLEDGAPAPTERRRPSRVLVILAVGVVLVGVASWVWLRGDAAEADAPPSEGPVVEVAQLTANLSGEQLRYARVGFAAVLSADALQPEVEARFPLLEDAAISEIARLTATDLTSPEGIDTLRNRLTARAHELYPDGDVVRLVITELLVQ